MKNKTSWRQNHVYILSCKHSSQPIRACVLCWLFYKRICTFTHSTFYVICHTNYPRLAPCRAFSIISRATADLIWRMWVRIYWGQNIFSLPHVVPKFLTHGLMFTGVYGLNLPEVGKLLVPSILSSFLIWTCWNLVQLSTGHVSFPFTSILFLKKDKGI